MTDIREQVARAMAEVYNQPGCDVPKDVLDSWIPYADAALAVAEPIIRADERERLAQDSDAEGWRVMLPASVDHSESVGPLADWLRAQNT
jgi:hypothetical protein